MKFLADYTATEQSALRNEICPEANDDQVNYFLRVCAARAIDPFSGLLYMQLRRQKATGKIKASVQPTVDGSRAAAARTGSYAGSDEPEFDDDDADYPKWCRVTVYRNIKSERFAFTAKCRYKEFVPQAPNDFQWRSKPFHMLSKVTEVQALRKAFAECVSATGEDDYETEDETPPAIEASREATKPKLAVDWLNAVNAFAKFGKTETDLFAYLLEVFNVDVSRGTLTLEHMDSLKVWYDELRREPPPKEGA